MMETLAEARSRMQQGDWTRAFQLMEPLAQTCDDLIESGWFTDDAESRFFNFRSAADEVVWRAHNEESRRVRKATDPFALVYHYYGMCLLEAKRHEESIAACTKAVRWNPSDVGMRFELGENYKILNDMASYERVLRDLYPYVATAADLAHYHRAMGYLRIELGNYQLAAAHLIVSLLFEDSPYPFNEIAYIKEQYGQEYTNMGPEEAFDVMDAFGERTMLDDYTYHALNVLLSESFACEEYEIALQCAQDLYGLTHDDHFGELAQQLTDLLAMYQEEE